MSRDARDRGHCPLNRRLMQVKPGSRTEPRVATDSAGRKDELPRPLNPGVRILTCECMWEDDTTQPNRKISLMLSAHVYEVPFQAQPHRVGQHDATILLSFSSPHRDLAALEIQIFDAQ